MPRAETETVLERPGPRRKRRQLLHWWHRRHSSARGLPMATALGAAACAAAWATVAVLCAPRGLDLTDESFYLLSYRWWDVNLDNFSGAQYFYGPVFEALGHDIAGLRIVRLAMLLVAHGVFGHAFMRWLRCHRPLASPSRWWEVAGTATIVACSGIVYSWLPLSPGYNDLALVCTVLGAAAVLRIARDAEVGARPAWWPPFGIGVVAVVFALAKWSSCLLVLACLGAALLVVVGRHGWRRLLALAGLVAAGALTAVVLIHLLLVPLPTLLPPLLEVNSLVAGSTNSPTALLRYYSLHGGLLLGDLGQQHGPLLLMAALLPFIGRFRRTSVALTLVALALAAVQVARHDGVMAGSPNLPAFLVTVFAPLAAVAVLLVSTGMATLRDRGRGASCDGGLRETAPRRVVYAMLVALPLAQAAGTGNPVHYLAVTGLGVWAAAVTAVLTAPSIDRVARLLVAGSMTGLVLATTLIAVDGLWNRPYRTSGYAASTATAEDVPALASLRLDPGAADDYARLRAELRAYVEPPGRAMMAFDGMAGIVLLLDGRPVGEAWYSGTAPERSAAGIRRACDGSPWWGERTPLVLFSRPVTRLERGALRACGLSLRRDFRELFAEVDGRELEIFVPHTAEEQP